MYKDMSQSNLAGFRKWNRQRDY